MSPRSVATLATSVPTPVESGLDTEPLPTATKVKSTNPPIQTPATPTEITPVKTTLAFTPAPTIPTFETITVENFDSLQKVWETRVDYDSSTFAGWFQLVFRSDTEWYVSSYAVGGVQILDLDTKQVVILLEDEELFSGELVISEDGRYLATISPWSHQVSLWDLNNFDKLSTFPQPFRGALGIDGGVFSNDNQYLAVYGCHYWGEVYCFSSTVVVYNMNTGEIALEIVGQQAAVTGLAFSADNRFLFMSGRGESIRDADFLIWDLEKNQRHFELSLGKDNKFIKLALSDDGSTLALSPYHGNIGIWNAKSWEEIGEIEAEGYCCMTFMPGTDLLLFVKPNTELMLARGNEILISFDVGWSGGSVVKFFVSPDGRFLYILNDLGLLQKWGVVH